MEVAFTTIAIVLIMLHDVDGHETLVNVDHIVSLHSTSETTGQRNTLVAKGIRCMVGMSNGSRIAVKEDCTTVRQAIQQEEKRAP
jgi:uncharacterized protein YlzI (FlbEa/FlbD family)